MTTSISPSLLFRHLQAGPEHLTCLQDPVLFHLTTSTFHRASLSNMVVRDELGNFTTVTFNGPSTLVVVETAFLGVIYTLMNPRSIFGVIHSLCPEHYHDQVATILWNQ